MDWVFTPTFLAGLIGYLIVVVAVAWIPGAIARSRGHENAAAISVCGWLSLVFPLCWPVAFVWAFTGPDRSKPQGTVRAVTKTMKVPDEVEEWEKRHGKSPP